MALSPQQLEAGNVLFQNQGIRVSPRLTSAVNRYTTLTGISDLLATITTGASGGNITTPTIQSLKTLAANTCPALGDAVPSGYIELTAPTTPPGFTGLISNTANTLVGDGDVGKFAQILSVASSYVDSTNQFINAGVNSEDYLRNTFSSMDNLTSSDLTFVTTNPQAVAADLKKLGNLINLATVEVLGSPLALLQQVVKQGGFVTSLVEQLFNQGLPYETILTLTDPKTAVTPTVEKAIYTAMTNIKNSDLVQIAQILGVTLTVTNEITAGTQLAGQLNQQRTINGQLNSMADLLNIQKIFPTSYMTLITPTCDGVKNIYVANPTVAGSSSGVVSGSASGYNTYIVPYPGRIVKYGEVLYGYLYNAVPNSAFTTNWGLSGTADEEGYASLGYSAQYIPGYTTYEVYTTTGTFKETIYVAGIGEVATDVVFGTQTPEVQGQVDFTLEQELPVYAMEGYTSLSKIIPSDQALASRSLSISLQQITNITKMTLPNLALAYNAVETNTGLPDIMAQKQAVPSEDREYFTTPTGLAVGTGQDGTILLTDIIGTPTGAGVVDALMTSVNTITNLNSIGSLSTLNTTYSTMYSTVRGLNTTGPESDPLSPYYGQYKTTVYGSDYWAVTVAQSINTAFTSNLIPQAYSQLQAIVAAKPAETTTMNVAFVSMADHLVNQLNLQIKSNMDIGNLTANSQTAVQGLITSLPQYGKNVMAGGSAEYLEGVANVEIRGGQAIVGVMRNSRTRTGLLTAGVGVYPEINTNPAITPPSAILSSGS